MPEYTDPADIPLPSLDTVGLTPEEREKVLRLMEAMGYPREEWDAVLSGVIGMVQAAFDADSGPGGSGPGN